MSSELMFRLLPLRSCIAQNAVLPVVVENSDSFVIAVVVVCTLLLCEPSTRYLPLYVTFALSLIWSMLWSSSFWIVARSLSVFVSLAALMTFSLRVFRMSTVLETAPSATFIMLVPFCVFWFAWSRPRIWTRMRSEIA